MDARRIALIKPSALGDIVHALPVLDRPAQPLPRRAHHLGRQHRLRAAARGPPRPHRHAAVRPRRVQEGPAPRQRYSLSLRRRAPPPALRPGHRPARAAPHRADVPRPPARRVRVGFANAREGQPATPTPTASTCPTPTASTPWTATGASPRRSARATDRSASTSRSIRSEWPRPRDELADLPRPWLAVAVGARVGDQALADRRTSPNCLQPRQERVRRHVPVRRHGRGHRRCRSR